MREFNKKNQYRVMVDKSTKKRKFLDFDLPSGSDSQEEKKVETNGELRERLQNQKALDSQKLADILPLSCKLKYQKILALLKEDENSLACRTCCANEQCNLRQELLEK